MRPAPGRGGAGAALVAVLALAQAAPLSGQAMEALSSRADGAVAMTFATRPGVRVCASGIQRTDGWNGRVEWRDGAAGRGEACRTGTVEVEITMSGGRVSAFDILGLDETPGADVRRLGRVSVHDAVDALLSVAREADSRVAEDAIHAVVLADSVEVWPALLELARDRERPGGVRKSALFWLGQETAEAVTANLVAAAVDDADEQDIRDAAVFALSQRPDNESLPALMDLATNAPDGRTRRSALFWLAQSDDPRIPGFFAEILRSSGGR